MSQQVKLASLLAQVSTSLLFPSRGRLLVLNLQTDLHQATMSLALRVVPLIDMLLEMLVLVVLMAIAIHGMLVLPRTLVVQAMVVLPCLSRLPAHSLLMLLLLLLLHQIVVVLLPLRRPPLLLILLLLLVDLVGMLLLEQLSLMYPQLLR